MRQQITTSLQSLVAAHQVKILFACESGSRAWGFPSPDSDYDARFIYVQKPEAYLSLSDAKEQLSLPLTGELDICGWDLRKALRLLYKSNCTPFEWLQSPVVYMEQKGFRESMTDLLPLYFNGRRQVHHYLGIAQGALATMQGKQIGVKKLFYVLRPLLAANWIATIGEYPPMTLQPLLELAPASIQRMVNDLMRWKTEAVESAPVEVPGELMQFMTERMRSLAESAPSENRMSVSTAPLDAYFQKMLSC
ncbi:nucleotidyltransferase domain-containing protein [Chitinophaga sp. NPDC101104]|uniref:nucleotidyltransferase domain-containing protein n=1 Tax=Chitinophaga sp. NPDC101104 TaxID=3390561 RepID=UPI003CFDF8D6